MIQVWRHIRKWRQLIVKPVFLRILFCVEVRIRNYEGKFTKTSEHFSYFFRPEPDFENTFVFDIKNGFWLNGIILLEYMFRLIRR